MIVLTVVATFLAGMLPPGLFRQITLAQWLAGRRGR